MFSQQLTFSIKCRKIMILFQSGNKQRSLSKSISFSCQPKPSPFPPLLSHSLMWWAGKDDLRAFSDCKHQLLAARHRQRAQSQREVYSCGIVGANIATQSEGRGRWMCLIWLYFRLCTKGLVITNKSHHQHLLHVNNLHRAL